MKKIAIIGLVLVVAAGVWWMNSTQSGSATGAKGVLAKIVAPKKSEPFESKLVSFVPRDAHSIQRCNYDSESYRRYLGSPLVKIALSFFEDPDKIRTTIESLNGGKSLDELNIPQLGAALEKLKQINQAVKSTEGFQDPFYAKDALVFQRPTSAANPLSVAVVFSTNRKMDLDGLVGKLRGLGAVIGDATDEGVSYYTYNLMELVAAFANADTGLPIAEMPKATLHFGIRDDRFAIGTAKEDILPFLLNKPFATPPDLLLTDYAKTTLARANYNPESDYCIQYGDYRRVLSDMAAQIEAMAKGNTPEDEKTKRGVEMLRKLPLLGYTSSMRYDDGFDLLGSFGLEVKNEQFDLTPWIKYFTTSTPAASATLLPASSFFVQVLNTSDLAKGLREALKQLPAPAQADTETTIAAAEGITSFAYAINYVAGEALFPDLTVVIAAKSPEAIIAQLRSIPAKIPQANTFGDWIEKTIEGTRVAFIASPFGVGAFLATVNNHVVVASSEVAIRRAILVGSKKEKSLADTLEARSLPKGEHALYYLYIDMPRVIQTVDGLKGAVAGFMPPEQQAQLNIPPLLTELFDAVGAISVEFSLKDSFVDFRAKQKVNHRGAAV